MKGTTNRFGPLYSRLMLPVVLGIVFVNGCAQQSSPAPLSSARADLPNWETVLLKEQGIKFKRPPDWRRQSDLESKKENYFHEALELDSPTRETITISITIDTYQKGFVSLRGNVVSKKEALEEDFNSVMQSMKSDSSIGEVKKLTLSGVEGVFRIFHVDFKDKDLGVRNGIVWTGHRIYQGKAQEIDILISSNPQRKDLLRTIFNTIELEQDKDAPLSSAPTRMSGSLRIPGCGYRR